MAQDPGSGPLEKVTLLQTGDRSDDIYDDWAAAYERDLLDEFGYSGHAIASDALTDALTDHGAAVVDYGCGTGLVGERLAALGFTTVDGADYSPGMLEQCRAKHVYRRLFLADLTEPIDVADATYDAMICVGVMGAGHLVPEHFAELFRTVKPRSPIVLFGNGTPYVEEGYAERFAALETAGHWTIESTTFVNYMAALNRPGVLVVGRR